MCKDCQSNDSTQIKAGSMKIKPILRANRKGDSALAQTVTEVNHLYSKAIEIRRKLLRPSHPLTAGSLSNLGWHYFNLSASYGWDKWYEAKRCFREALHMYKRYFGWNHPKTAVGYNNLQLLYTEMERRDYDT